ncbi:peptidase inhibitor family I36 protein [Nonomuraea sp. NEAU-A123]|nr:peptidase inhibitor family I36 protein [Nonomuraea sp. NEAU-A123]
MTALAAGMALSTTPADAATGTLILSSSPSGPRIVFNNPTAGCHSTTSAFTTVTNRTNVFATVYQGAQCQGMSLVVAPGTNPMPVGERLSVSVPS